METNLTLLQKYVELGFTISRVGRGSSALRFQDRVGRAEAGIQKN
jgi:hypothetical protein